MTHIVDLLLDSFEDNKKYYDSLDDKELEILDGNLIHQLKWLSYDEKQSFEILKQSNRLVRKFLVNDRPRSAKATFTYLEERLNCNYRTTIEQWISNPNYTLNNVGTLFQPNNQKSPAFINGKPLSNYADLKQKFIEARTLILSETVEFRTPEEIHELEMNIIEDLKREFVDNKNEENIDPEMKNKILGVEIQNSIREHLALYSYLQVLKLFEEWTILSNKLSFVQFSSNEKAMSKLSQNDVQLMADLESSLYKILKCSPAGWLLDPPSPISQNGREDDFSMEMRLARVNEIEKIRLVVIPNAFAILHDIFSYTGKITSCIELADLVADVQYKFKRCFPEQILTDLMNIITKSQVKEIEIMKKSDQ
jgi:hypothetical protein